MDYLFGLSTWPLLLVKALLSALNLFFTLAFSFLDSQPTQPLSKENAGFPQSSSTFNLFCLMDYIHNQLTQLLQHETTLFTFFLVFAVFYWYLLSQIDQETTAKHQVVQLVCFLLSSFFHIFLIFLSYRPSKQGHRNGSSNIALGYSQPSVPNQEGNEYNLRMTVSSSDLTFSQFIIWV